MSFWGLSQTGKDAQGQLGELPRWSKGAMTQDMTRNNTAYDQAGQYNTTYSDYLNNRLQNGFGTPQDIRAWGAQAMPGVDTAMQSIRDAYGKVQTPQDTAGQQNQNIGASQAYDDQAYQGLRQGNDTAFNNAKNLTSNIYGTLIPQTATAYSTAQDNLKRLLPGGDLLAADAARSFAPAMAASQRRLRTAGVDPNSPEASGILQSVDTARGRSMDDVLAQNMGNYVSQGNTLTLGANDAQNQLGLGRTNDINNLNLQQNSKNSQDLQSQMQTNQNLMNQRNQVVQNLRDMGVQDADIQKAIETLGLNLSNQQFQTGEQGIGLNLEQQNNAANGIGSLASQQYGLSNTLDNSARGWNQQAFSQNGQDLGVEGQNAGWGTKLLTGLAEGGLNFLAPGAGTALGAGLGTMGVGGGSTFGAGSPYGYGGTPSFAQGAPGTSGMNWLGGLYNSFKKPTYASTNTDGSGNYGY